MKASYSWLKEHLPLSLSASELAGHLVSLGFEVASIETRGPAFKGVVAAEILEIGKHPNADRLSLCKVTDGTSTLSIVCGAKNIAVGQRVPLARIGAALPGGHKISRSKIRGVESEGMICSSTELGLGADNGGIMVMDAKTALGTDIAGLMGGSDEIFDVEITPNRPDCLSHLGLARELSAFFRMPLKAQAFHKAAEHGAPSVRVENDALKACPRYMGRELKDIKVAPSPSWLAQRLESIGLRPINNVVDITNFILMDMGQPLHAFDADKLEGGKVVVRFARADETLNALDGREYGLSPEFLVIADARRPAAIAGVMGGEPSAVTEKTRRVFLESAHFLPPVVRRTSQGLRLRSDSSIRFERGTDIEAVGAASERAAALIAELALASCSAPEDVRAEREPKAPIVVTSERINGILGSAFQDREIQATLAALSSESRVKGSEISFPAPSYRGDLETPWDLAEEIARHLGFANIPAKIPQGPLRPPRELPSARAARNCRARLADLGLFEAYNYDFISEKMLAQSGLRESPGHAFARLQNPLNEDWTVLRPSLIPGLLQSAARNLNAGAASVRLFELGKVYRRDGSGMVENARLSGILLGPRAEAHWQDARPAPSDLYEAKGLAEELFRSQGALEWTEAGPETASDPLFQGQSRLRLKVCGISLGTVGLLSPRVARAWELERERPALFDFDLDAAAGLEPGKLRFAPFSIFPSSKRDLSFFIDAAIPFGKLEDSVRECRIEELTELALVDVFMGKGVPEGQRSLTIRLSFGRMDRTLRDAEVNAAVERVLDALKKGFSIALRA